ncbi:MAG: hypothetical protein PHY28_08795 [Dehalococcoidales bacterium]|nr:hypothetical protein [Dehalococcoidales bacterium]
MTEHFCSCCGAAEGEYHLFGCESELCPFCGGQLITCGCYNRILRIDASHDSGVAKQGLAKKQAKQQEKFFNEFGRIPHLHWAMVCARCGAKNLPTPTVTEVEWNKYVVPWLQHDPLCQSCYEEMKRIFPEGWEKAKPYSDHRKAKG